MKTNMQFPCLKEENKVYLNIHLSFVNRKNCTYLVFVHFEWMLATYWEYFQSYKQNIDIVSCRSTQHILSTKKENVLFI